MRCGNGLTMGRSLTFIAVWHWSQLEHWVPSRTQKQSPNNGLPKVFFWEYFLRFLGDEPGSLDHWTVMPRCA